jgi:hypothetical protein
VAPGADHGAALDSRTGPRFLELPKSRFEILSTFVRTAWDGYRSHTTTLGSAAVLASCRLVWCPPSLNSAVTAHKPAAAHGLGCLADFSCAPASRPLR